MTTPEETTTQLAAIANRLRSGASILVVEIELQVKHLTEAGVPVTVAQIEQQLRRPLADASPDMLRGVIAGLNAVNKPAGTDR